MFKDDTPHPERDELQKLDQSIGSSQNADAKCEASSMFRIILHQVNKWQELRIFSGLLTNLNEHITVACNVIDSNASALWLTASSSYSTSSTSGRQRLENELACGAVAAHAQDTYVLGRGYILQGSGAETEFGYKVGPPR